MSSDVFKHCPASSVGSFMLNSFSSVNYYEAMEQPLIYGPLMRLQMHLHLFLTKPV